MVVVKVEYVTAKLSVVNIDGHMSNVGVPL